MKIIGESFKGRYIVEIGEDEIAKICGERYMMSLKPRPNLGIGVIINVHEIFTWAESMRSLPYEIDQLRARLDTAKKLCDIPESLAGVIKEMKAARE